jgi:hypothetical protein
LDRIRKSFGSSNGSHVPVHRKLSHIDILVIEMQCSKADLLHKYIVGTNISFVTAVCTPRCWLCGTWIDECSAHSLFCRTYRISRSYIQLPPHVLTQCGIEDLWILTHMDSLYTATCQSPDLSSWSGEGTRNWLEIFKGECQETVNVNN